MGRTLNQKIARLPVNRRAQVKERAAELIAEELSLQDLKVAQNGRTAVLSNSLLREFSNSP